MTQQEFNKDFWIIYQDSLIPRSVISLPRLYAFVGCKIYVLYRKLDNFLGDKFVWKPFHGVKVIIYRH